MVNFIFAKLVTKELKREIYTVRLLKILGDLERVLIARWLLFKKIHIMPKGQSPMIKGAICNVPVDTVDLSDI